MALDDNPEVAREYGSFLKASEKIQKQTTMAGVAQILQDEYKIKIIGAGGIIDMEKLTEAMQIHQTRQLTQAMPQLTGAVMRNEAYKMLQWVKGEPVGSAKRLLLRKQLALTCAAMNDGQLKSIASDLDKMNVDPKDKAFLKRAVTNDSAQIKRYAELLEIPREDLAKVLKLEGDNFGCVDFLISRNAKVTNLMRGVSSRPGGSRFAEFLKSKTAKALNLDVMLSDEAHKSDKYITWSLMLFSAAMAYHSAETPEEAVKKVALSMFERIPFVSPILRFSEAEFKEAFKAFCIDVMPPLALANVAFMALHYVGGKAKESWKETVWEGIVREALRDLGDGDFEKTETGYYRLKNRTEYRQYLEEVAPGMGRVAKLASMVEPEVDARMSRSEEVRNNDAALHTLQYLEEFDLYLVRVRYAGQFDLEQIKQRVWEHGMPPKGAVSPVERVAAKIILDNLSVRARIYSEVLETFVDRIERRYNELKGGLQEDFDPSAIVVQTMAILKQDYEKAPREIQESPWGMERLKAGYRERIDYLKGFSGKGKAELEVRREMRRIIENFRRFIAELALGVSLYDEMETLGLTTHFYGGASSRTSTQEVLLGDVFRVGVSASVRPGRASAKWKVFHYMISRKSGDLLLLGSVSLQSSDFNPGNNGLWPIEAPEEKTFLRILPERLGEELDEEGGYGFFSVLAFGDWADPVREVGYPALARPIDYAHLFSKERAAFASSISELILVKPAISLKAPRFIYQMETPDARVWLKVPEYALAYSHRGQCRVSAISGGSLPKLIPEKIEKISTQSETPSLVRIVFSGQDSEEGTYLLEVDARVFELPENAQPTARSTVFEYARDFNPLGETDTRGENDPSKILKELDQAVQDAEGLAAEASKGCGEANSRAIALEKSVQKLRRSLLPLQARIKQAEADVDKARQLSLDISRFHSEAERAAARTGEAAHRMEALTVENCEDAKTLLESRTPEEAERLSRRMKGNRMNLAGLEKQAEEALTAGKKAAQNARQSLHELSSLQATIQEWGNAGFPSDADAVDREIADIEGTLASAGERIRGIEEIRLFAHDLMEKLKPLLEGKGKKEKETLSKAQRLMNRIAGAGNQVRGCPEAVRAKMDGTATPMEGFRADLSKVNESRQILLRILEGDGNESMTQALEKVEMAQYVVELAEGYLERLKTVKADAEVCITLAEETLHRPRILAMPNVSGMTLEQASGLIRQSGLNVDARVLGGAQRPELEYRVASQTPAAGSPVNSGSTVILAYHGPFDPGALIAKTDCSRFPGTEPVWDQEDQKVVCRCLLGLFLNADNTACIDCNDYWNWFHDALMQTDVGTAEQYHRQAVNCPWYGDGIVLLADLRRFREEEGRKDQKCIELHNSFLSALQSGLLDQAREILARAQGCDFQQQGHNDLCNQIGGILNDAKRRNDIPLFQRFLAQAKGCTFFEQANADLRQMELNERCNQLGTALTEAKRRQDIHRFRSLVSQAQNCVFYPQALADLHNMERQARPSVTPDPQPAPPPPDDAPVSPGAREAFIQAVEQRYKSRWYPYWCEKLWSGCAVVPKGAKDQLVSWAQKATRQKQIERYYRMLECFDGCVMAHPKSEKQERECGQRCRQIP